MAHQYKLTKHTILPLIYRIFHSQTKSISYLINDPKTKSLLLFAHPKNNPYILQHLDNIQLETQAELKYAFVNQDSKFSQVKKQTFISPSIQGDLKPLVIGDISVCFIDAKGYSPTFSLIAITHMTQTSTKFPVILPGSLLGVSSIDYNSQVSAQNYINSLQKIKYFPNQTYIFPTNTTNVKDLTLAKQLSQGNNSSSLLNQKIRLFKQNEKYNDALIPTTIMQQKMMNPFLSPEKYMSLLGTSDRFKAFTIMKKMRAILNETHKQ